MGLPGRARGGTENESTASGFPSPSGAASGSVPWAEVAPIWWTLNCVKRRLLPGRRPGFSGFAGLGLFSAGQSLTRRTDT